MVVIAEPIFKPNNQKNTFTHCLIYKISNKTICLFSVAFFPKRTKTDKSISDKLKNKLCNYVVHEKLPYGT